MPAPAVAAAAVTAFNPTEAPVWSAEPIEEPRALIFSVTAEPTLENVPVILEPTAPNTDAVAEPNLPKAPMAVDAAVLAPSGILSNADLALSCNVLAQPVTVDFDFSNAPPRFIRPLAAPENAELPLTMLPRPILKLFASEEKPRADLADVLANSSSAAFSVLVAWVFASAAALDLASASAWRSWACSSLTAADWACVDSGPYLAIAALSLSWAACTLMADCL